MNTNILQHSCNKVYFYWFQRQNNVTQIFVGCRSLQFMEKVEVYEVVKMTEEGESCYSQMGVTTSKKRKIKAEEESVEKTKKPR